MLIGGVELTAADVAWLEGEGQRGCSRSELARKLCERKQLVSATGRSRIVTARIDISRHARAGRLSLPEAACPAPPGRRRPLRQGMATTNDEGERARSLAELGDMTVALIAGPSDPRHVEWIEALDRHHYLGSGPLCGAQLRYIVLAQGHVVAAASFSSAARQVAARDEFVGWSAAARRQNRRLVINQSRFCCVLRTPNLATRVQSLLLHRVSDDWRNRYGDQPVLVETFVDSEKFRGTCYRAANWSMVGKTSGRGRQDRARRADLATKSIWLYPLQEDWRDRLCIEPVASIDPDADWAEVEWGRVDLGDRRLERRLVRFGRSRFAKPTANLPQSCGSRAATKAAYRLLQHDSANLHNLLSSHCEATISRAAQESTVLAIQDTTSLNYTTHRATEGLGPITSVGASGTLGMQVHSVLVASVTGMPLGLLDINAWSRDPEQYGTKHTRERRPTKDKESNKWIRGYEAADAAARRLDKTRVVVVGDREADVFDLLKRASEGVAELLVRATQPRRILADDGTAEGPLWECVRGEQVAGVMQVQLPRSGSRAARVAHLELRFRKVVVRQPRFREDSKGKNKQSRPVTVFAIAATETAESAGETTPIEWLLLSTIPVTTLAEAEEKVAWYAQRWLIEVFHRTLKTGCGIERRQSEHADSLKSALAVDAVVAWRVMWLVKSGREAPDVPCSVFFEEYEWKALHCFVHQTKIPPDTPPPLRTAVHMVASLGGFLGRKSDGEPGAQTVWRGLERLTDLSAAFRLFFDTG